MDELKSKPYFSGFSPDDINYQREVIDFLDDWDYSTGTPEVLLSGSYGSAKSLLMAHLAVRHCLEWPGARVCLARKALPDLKATIFNEILEHLDNDPQFIEGTHYEINRTSASIKFINGSEIISRSWADKKYNKGRSLKLSMLVFEELTENNEDDYAAFKTLKARLRRIPTVKENILIGATNPDDPDHWVAKYFINSTMPTRRVFYSVTTDNPFLDPVYIEQLKQDLSPAEAERYIYGRWTRLDRERIYSSYSDENFIKKPYEINKQYPITICHDFNIGEGKPMSAACYQYINDEFHIFKEFVINGARTLDLMEAMKESGLFDIQVPHFIIHGDGSGHARDTRSFVSDYDLITKFIANQTKAKAILEVPKDNPPVRARHNKVNAYFLNEAKKRRAFIYQDCKVADEGFRLTALKKGGDYIEDDSKYYQHITTAIGYGIYYDSNKSNVKISSQKVR